MNYKISLLIAGLALGACGKEPVPQERPVQVIIKRPEIKEILPLIDKPVTLFSFCQITNLNFALVQPPFKAKFPSWIAGTYLNEDQIRWLIIEYKLRYEYDVKAKVVNLNSKAIIVDSFPSTLKGKLPAGAKILIMTPKNTIQTKGLSSELKINEPSNAQVKETSHPQKIKLTSSAATSVEDNESWVSELERAILKHGYHVIDRTRMPDIIREKELSGQEAIVVSGADAILQITDINKRDDDCYTSCVSQQIYDRSSGGQIESIYYEMFYINASARLILGNSEVIWSGTVHFPSTALAKPGSLRGAISVVEERQDKSYTEIAPAGKLKNSRLIYIWDDPTGTNFVNEEEGLSSRNDALKTLMFQGAFNALVKAFSQ